MAPKISPSQSPTASGSVHAQRLCRWFTLAIDMATLYALLPAVTTVDVRPPISLFVARMHHREQHEEMKLLAELQGRSRQYCTFHRFRLVQHAWGLMGPWQGGAAGLRDEGKRRRL